MMDVFMNFDRKEEILVVFSFALSHAFPFPYKRNAFKIYPSSIFVPKFLQVVFIFRAVKVEDKHLHCGGKVTIHVDSGDCISGVRLYERMKTVVGPLERATALDHSFHSSALCVNEHRHFGTLVLYREYLVDADVIPSNVIQLMASVVEESAMPNNVVKRNDISLRRIRR